MPKKTETLKNKELVETVHAITNQEIRNREARDTRPMDHDERAFNRGAIHVLKSIKSYLDNEAEIQNKQVMT